MDASPTIRQVILGGLAPEIESPAAEEYHHDDDDE
jgi:hypothetical protein